MAAMQTERICQQLANGVRSSRELEADLDASQSVVSRALRALIDDGRVIRIGQTRGARYGLLRPIGNVGSRWPLRQIDPDGHIHHVGQLHALAAGQYFFDSCSRLAA